MSGRSTAEVDLVSSPAFLIYVVRLTRQLHPPSRTNEHSRVQNPLISRPETHPSRPQMSPAESVRWEEIGPRTGPLRSAASRRRPSRHLKPNPLPKLAHNGACSGCWVLSSSGLGFGVDSGIYHKSRAGLGAFFFCIIYHRNQCCCFLVVVVVCVRACVRACVRVCVCVCVLSGVLGCCIYFFFSFFLSKIYNSANWSLATTFHIY